MPRHESVKVWQALPKHDQLAIDNRSCRQAAPQRLKFRVPVGVVRAFLSPEAPRVVFNRRHGAHAVPLDFEDPRGIVERRRRYRLRPCGGPWPILSVPSPGLPG
jgi:hypothetical protein